LHHLGDRQITELLAHPYQLVYDRFKFTHGLNLLMIQGKQFGIGQAQGDGFFPFLAGEQRIGAELDPRAVCVFDGEELLGQRAAPEFPQIGQLLEEGLALVFEV
jgi:hypothetical protein